MTHGVLTRWLVVEPARPRRIANWSHAPWLAVGTVCFGAFMGQLDASIVTLAFPAIGASFHASLAAVQWVSLSYLLTLVALLAPVGRLADAFGRKQLYLYGFALFTLASAACGLAPTLPLLIGFRVLQAVGAALLQANSVALVTTSVPAERVRGALGVQAAAQALGLALGPVVGGVLVQGLGWQWVFGVTVPVGVLALLAGRYLLPRTRQRTPAGAFDWPGVLLLAVSSTAALLALSSVSGLHLRTAQLVALIWIAVAAGWGFYRRQRRTSSPLVDLRLLREPAISGGLLAALGGYLVLFGPLVLIPVLGGGSALRAGLLVTALPAGFGLAATIGGQVLPRTWPHRMRCALGAGITTFSLAGLAGWPHVIDAPQVLVPGMALAGIGLGLFTPANNALVMGAIPAARSGVGGGLVNMARGLGTSLGVALVAAAAHLTAPGSLSRVGFAALAVIALAVVCVASFTPDHPTRRGLYVVPQQRQR
jgi:MFS family permease